MTRTRGRPGCTGCGHGSASDRSSRTFTQGCYHTMTRLFAPGACGRPVTWGKSTPMIRDQVLKLASDPSPDVRLQVAIAATKIEDVDPLPTLLDVQHHSRWRSADPAHRLAKPASDAAKSASSTSSARSRIPMLGTETGSVQLAPHAIEKLLASPRPTQGHRALCSRSVSGRTSVARRSMCWLSDSVPGTCRHS